MVEYVTNPSDDFINPSVKTSTTFHVPLTTSKDDEATQKQDARAAVQILPQIWKRKAGTEGGLGG